MVTQQMLFDGMAAQASPVKPPRPVDHAKQNRNQVFRELEDQLSEMCRTVLEKVKAAGEHGATREEIAIYGNPRIPLPTVCGRMHDLKRNGLVIETGTRRPTSSGKTAVVVYHWEFAKQSE